MKKYKQAAVLLTAAFLILCAGCRTAGLELQPKPAEGPFLEGVEFQKINASEMRELDENHPQIILAVTKATADLGTEILVTNNMEYEIERIANILYYQFEDAWYLVTPYYPPNVVQGGPGQVKSAEQLAQDLIPPGETRTLFVLPVTNRFEETVTLLPGTYQYLVGFYTRTEDPQYVSAVAEFTLEWE